jgi:hypothetical protein
MIPFLNRDDAKWAHTRQIKIAGRNHILPPLGIAWKTKHNDNSQEGIKIEYFYLKGPPTKMSSTRQSSS